MELLRFCSRTLSNVTESTTSVKVGFAYRLVSPIEAGKVTDPRWKTLASTALKSLWQDFTFDSGVVEPRKSTFSTLYVTAAPKLTSPVDDRGLFITGHEIWVLLEKSKEILPSFDMDHLCEKMCLSIREASIDTMKHTILPLVELIVVHETSVFSTADQGPSKSGRTIVTTAIEHLIKQFVAKEPQAPQTWAQPIRGCGSRYCADCTSVNEFLADPRQQIGRFPVAKMRRLHLHQNFTDKMDKSYKVATLRGFNPNVWEITKNNDGYKQEHLQWKGRLDSATEYMDILGRSGRLKLFLEDAFDAMTSLRVEKVISFQERAPMAHTVESRKRPLEDDASVGNREKRVFSKVLNVLGEEQDVEVIDLT